MPLLRVLQVSDLHAGTQEEPEVEGDLRTLVAETEPELVIASGDLTHRNTRAQHERAAALLRSLDAPLLVIPGNHDIPRWPPWRFTATFDEFTQGLGRDRAHVSLRPARGVRVELGATVEAAGRRPPIPTRSTRCAGASPRQPPEPSRSSPCTTTLLGAPWRSTKRTIANRSTVLGGLVDAGAELIVSGHVHQAAVAERREFEVVRGDVHGTTVVTAPGLGQPRPKRRGEARGLHLYEADEKSLRVLTYAWAETSWAQIADRRFPRGLEPLGSIG